MNTIGGEASVAVLLAQARDSMADSAIEDRELAETKGEVAFENAMKLKEQAADARFRKAECDYWVANVEGSLAIGGPIGQFVGTGITMGDEGRLEMLEAIPGPQGKAIADAIRLSDQMTTCPSPIENSELGQIVDKADRYEAMHAEQEASTADNEAERELKKADDAKDLRADARDVKSQVDDDARALQEMFRDVMQSIAGI
jgi:hypothetical protein